MYKSSFQDLLFGQKIGVSIEYTCNDFVWVKMKSTKKLQ